MKREEIVLHRSAVDKVEQASGASRVRQRFMRHSLVGGAGRRSAPIRMATPWDLEVRFISTALPLREPFSIQHSNRLF